MNRQHGQLHYAAFLHDSAPQLIVTIFDIGDLVSTVLDLSFALAHFFDVVLLRLVLLNFRKLLIVTITADFDLMSVEFVQVRVHLAALERYTRVSVDVVGNEQLVVHVALLRNVVLRVLNSHHH